MDDLFVTSSPTLTTAKASAGLAGAEIWGIIAAILAIVGGILVYFLFVNTKAEPKGKFAKWLKNFLAFKTMWIESILKVLYYMATIFMILISFTLISVDFIAFLIAFASELP